MLRSGDSCFSLECPWLLLLLYCSLLQNTHLPPSSLLRVYRDVYLSPYPFSLRYTPQPHKRARTENGSNGGGREKFKKKREIEWGEWDCRSEDKQKEWIFLVLTKETSPPPLTKKHTHTHSCCPCDAVL